MEVAGFVVGATSLVLELFHVGKVGFEVLGKSEAAAKDLVVVLTRVRLEKARYDAWAEEAGLTAENPWLFAERGLDSPATIALLVDVLAQICDLTTEGLELQKRYGLKATPPLTTFPQGQSVPVELAGAHKLLWSQAHQDARKESLKVFKGRLPFIKKLEWAVRHKEQFENLVDQLKDLNVGLRYLLPPVQRNILDRALLIKQPSHADALAILSSEELVKREQVSRDYAAAARFKRLALGNSAASPGSQPALPIPLNGQQVDFNRIRVDRGITSYAGQKVLIEIKWIRLVDARLEAILKERVRSLVALLQVRPKPHNYRLLDCIGYCEAPPIPQIAVRYGILFELPERVQSLPCEAKSTDLYDIIGDRNDRHHPSQYPLGLRYRLAALAASSVAELHAAGWLHHNLGSHNVLFFNDSTKSWDMDRPYISGFNYARADDVREVSEASARTEDKFYQHPEYQTNRQIKFRRSYDLYSLGIVLVEIGFWRRISTFDEEGGLDAHAFAERIKKKIVPRLSFLCGEEYMNATLRCLDASKLRKGDDEGALLTEAFSRDVVGVLEALRA